MSPERISQLWRFAWRRVRRGLHLRRLWSTYGVFLREAEQRAVWEGLERRGGKLQRAIFFDENHRVLRLKFKPCPTR